MWRDYCARLKQRSNGMGALRHQEAHFDSVSRSPKNVFEPPQPAKMREQQQTLFPAGLCPPCLDGEDKDLATSLQTHIIWSPLFDGVELSSGLKEGSGADLPVGWRTAEQKLLELKNLDRSSCNGEFVNFVSSSASNSDEEPQAVWASAKCLLHMKDIKDSSNDQGCGPRPRDLEDEFLLKTCDLPLSFDLSEDFEKQGLSSRNIMVESYSLEMEKLSGYHSELSTEESKYQSCSAGDSSVSGGCGIGRGGLDGRLSKHEFLVNGPSADTHAGDSFEARSSIMKTSTSNDPRRHSRVNREQKLKATEQPKKNLMVESEQQVKHAGDRRPGRRASLAGVKEDGCGSSRIASQRWNSTGRSTVQKRRELSKRVHKEDPVRSSELGKKSSESRGNDGQQQQQRRNHATFSDEVVSVASTTGEVEVSTTLRGYRLQQPHNTELVSALAEMNLRELRALQCSAAVMRHNIGILEDDIKNLLKYVERKNSPFSWWRLVKDFMVAAGLVTGAFGLRTLIDIVRKNTYRQVGATLQKITNKQEKMALAAFLLTVGARFGKQLWSHKRDAAFGRKTSICDQLNRIRERVTLMSHLATTATVDVVRALPPPGESE